MRELYNTCEGVAESLPALNRLITLTRFKQENGQRFRQRRSPLFSGSPPAGRPAARPDPATRGHVTAGGHGRPATAIQ